MNDGIVYRSFFVVDEGECPWRLSAHAAAAETYSYNRTEFIWFRFHPYSTPDVDQ